MLRFHYHKPKEIWENLKDLSLPRKAFSSEMAEVPAVKQFITEDEIGAALSGGSGFAGGKGRIYAFFQQPHTDKEKTAFLRQEYGTGGRSHALSGATHSGEDHDGKGLRYQKNGCDDVRLTWDKVVKLVAGLIQKDRYLTEAEREQYEKIQAEKELAEAGIVESQSQPAPVHETETELPQPALEDVLEQYKPVVTAAIMEDTAYRNACGHTDHENAVIEGNAAVRRAVLGSGNMQLLKQYSDVPEFRHRLHQEVIAETYPKLHELLRPLSQDDIDEALCAWNGDMDSKRAVVRYMKEHGREKDTAAWLSREYGGPEHTNLFIVRAGNPEEMELPWPKVQRRIAQLIKEDRFFTEAERDNLDDIDPIAIRENLAQRGIVNGQVVEPEKWTSEALFNLLDNAVKYTPAGGEIAVSVVLWEMYVEIKVADTGKGISESNQAAIFRRFYREEEVHEQQGVGIGLYLAREIITRQGGYIKVVSEPGRGSEFSIMLPTK